MNKPAKQPAKYVPFGTRDSYSIEAAFQKLAESEEATEAAARKNKAGSEAEEGDLGERFEPKYKLREKKKVVTAGEEKVAVNEDYLFDVDLRKRELGPVYWLGPAYDVRRGTWFYQGKNPPTVSSIGGSKELTVVGRGQHAPPM